MGFLICQDVLVADSRMAVQSLLLTDELFRASSIATRKKYVQLVESVREHGGDVKICSALHVSGERTISIGHRPSLLAPRQTNLTLPSSFPFGAELKQLGGVAALLRFPLPDVGDEESDEEEEGSTTTTETK